MRPGRPAVVVSLLVCLVAVSCGRIGPRPVAVSQGTAFGTLASLPGHADEERQAGVTAATVELSWQLAEPEKSRFDRNYLDRVRATAGALSAAGRTITLELGLHNPPGWVLARPDSRMVNELGEQSNEANLVFDRRLRTEAEAYFARIADALDLSAVRAIRVTSGGSAELLYPGGGHYWAFDAGAQNGPDRPASMPPNPAPGWRPGQPGLDAAGVGRWAQWYVGALADVVGWQADAFSRLGYRSSFEVLTPGSGVPPAQFDALVRGGLPPGLLGEGAAWSVLYRQLPRRPGLVAYVSSVADTSGDDDSCTADDDATSLDSPDVERWSATRWITRIAHEYGYPVSGENPGFGQSPALDVTYRDPTQRGMLLTALRQARSCGFTTFYWAHDPRLWDGTVPFAAYAGGIAAS